MRLVADINTDFNQKPFYCTLLLELDLTSAFNHGEHNKLLTIIKDIGLPLYFIKFCKGFLNDRRFWVCYNNTLRLLAKKVIDHHKE